MSIFALASQSLKTGEPIHQIMPTSLIDRLLYHSSHHELAQRDDSREHIKITDRVSCLEFIYFAAGEAHPRDCNDEIRSDGVYRYFCCLPGYSGA